MNRIILFLAALLISSNVNSWGIIGHRTIGLIAENHLNKKASKKIKALLGHKTLALVSIWMDDERSNPDFQHATDWHWVTIPDGMTYEQTEKNPNGDIIAKIDEVIASLKKGGLSKEEEIIQLKILVHLIGDIHMPLHVGREDDMGGNAIKVRWFGRDSNLHRVWDSEIIDGKQFSFTELATALNHASTDQINLWQQQQLLDWAYESMSFRPQVYDIPNDNYIGYHYIYKNWDTVQLRLLQAGIRLAGVLNEIYS